MNDAKAPGSANVSGGVDPFVGRVIAGRFRLGSRLGQGGMGVVYNATQEPLGRSVVVKLIRDTGSDVDLERFSQEAKALSRFSHPHIVAFIDHGVVNGEMYIAMERLQGRTLHERLADGALTWRFALSRARQIALALGEAHTHGVVHRDLKPNNIMLLDHRGLEGWVKVLDFGIARFEKNEGQSLTATGDLVGTPGYISPEQIEGSPATERSDLYALGVILYQCLTSTNPFIADTPIGTLTRHLNFKAPPPSSLNADVPPAVDELVRRLLLKEPALRPKDANAVIAEIDAALGAGVNIVDEASSTQVLRKPSRAGPIARGVFAAASLVVGAAFFVGMSTSTPRLTTTFEAARTLPIDPLPAATPEPAAQVALGRALFIEPRLSKNEVVSCRTCHPDGAGTTAEPRTVLGVSGARVKYNTPSTLNAATLYRQTWTADVEDLGDVVERPLKNPDMMASSFELVVERLSADPTWRQRFADAGLALDARGVKTAIASYLRSAVPRDAPYDRFLRGDAAALNAQARRGAELFATYGCTSCHQGKAVGGNMVAVFGVMADPWIDRGVCASGDYCRSDVDCGGSSCVAPAPKTPADLGAGTGNDSHFRVPSLRNVALTGPYFHDGSARTLQKAVDVMARVQLGRSLDDADVDDIVAFLTSLTGEGR